jgi:undecaprenyl pyrophosphate synthase
MEQLTIDKLIEENKLLKEKINELTEHLKKYTAPKRNKKFYENHKEEIIKKVMEYKEKNKDKKSDPEKIKEYNRRAYLKRKEKNTENN